MWLENICYVKKSLTWQVERLPTIEANGNLIKMPKPKGVSFNLKKKLQNHLDGVWLNIHFMESKLVSFDGLWFIATKWQIVNPIRTITTISIDVLLWATWTTNSHSIKMIAQKIGRSTHTHTVLCIERKRHLKARIYIVFIGIVQANLISPWATNST